MASKDPNDISAYAEHCDTEKDEKTLFMQHKQMAQHALVQCVCGRRKTIMQMFKCYYCGLVFCPVCAPEHFGETVEDHRERRTIERKAKALTNQNK